MEQWQKSLANTINSPEYLAGRFGIDPEPLAPVVERYPMRITPYYLGLIKEADDPIWRQCVPDPRELEDDLPIDTFDGAKPRFLNRGKKRRSVSTLSIPRASDRGVEWVDFKDIRIYNIKLIRSSS